MSNKTSKSKKIIFTNKLLEQPFDKDSPNVQVPADFLKLRLKKTNRHEKVKGAEQTLAYVGYRFQTDIDEFNVVYEGYKQARSESCDLYFGKGTSYREKHILISFALRNGGLLGAKRVSPFMFIGDRGHGLNSLTRDIGVMHYGSTHIPLGENSR